MQPPLPIAWVVGDLLICTVLPWPWVRACRILLLLVWKTGLGQAISDFSSAPRQAPCGLFSRNLHDRSVPEVLSSPFVWKRKPKFQEMKVLVQHPTADRWQSRGLRRRSL